jgi:hypothetical protein
MFFKLNRNDRIYTLNNISEEYKYNTNRCFWYDIGTFITIKFSKIITGFGIYKDEYIELKLINQNNQIDEIVECLNNNQNIWYKYKFPRLELIILRFLKNKLNYSRSLIEYQQKYGYENTKMFIYDYEFLLF